MSNTAIDGLTIEERYRLAKRDSLAGELQRLLAVDESRDVRYSLAGRPALLLELQRLLVTDGDTSVRCSLAANPSLVPELQHLLAADAAVRLYLARNSSLIPELQRLLAMDADKDVRRALAGNGSVTLTATLPAAFLELSERGRDFVDATLAQAGLDPEDAATLRTDWTGTLEELLGTAAELSAAPA